MLQAEKVRDIEGEVLIKIDKDVIQTVVEYFNIQPELTTRDGLVERSELLSLAIEFMGS